MRYKEIVKILNKGTDKEVKEVTANVEFSTLDLIEWNSSLKASLETELDYSTREWVKSTIQDIEASLEV